MKRQTKHHGGCRVGVNRHGNLFFHVNWEGMRTWEGTALRDDPESRELVEARATLIRHEMRAGTFNYAKHFPQGNRFRREAGQKHAETDPTTWTIAGYYECWKADKIPPFVKKSRARKYKSHFDAHIIPLHGQKLLRSYHVAQIREIKVELVESKGLKLKTVKNVLNASLRALFRDAKAEGIIERNPFDDLPRNWWGKSPAPEPDPFTEKERDQILSYFQERYWPSWPREVAFIFALFWTGARPSELTARRWRDLDPHTGRLSISSSLTEGEEGQTKTAASERVIRLLPPVLAYLRAIKPLRVQPDEFIFMGRKGRPIDHESFGEHQFQGALTALRIRHRDFYHTRHTYISVMLTHGENVKKIAETVGTSEYMIYRRYGKYIGATEDFGSRALAASKVLTKVLTQKPLKEKAEQFRKVAMVRGGGLEPPKDENEQ